MVPFAWDNWGGREPATAVFHDEHDHRVRDVGGPGSPDWAAHVRQHKQEETDDELRLTYVALTRAQSHLLLWWAPSFNTPTSPLHRLLLHDDPAAVAPLSITVPDDATALAAFRARADRSNGGLGVEVVQTRPPRGVGTRGRAGAGAAARDLHPAARHRLAPHLLQRADLGGARAAAGQRAGGRAEGRRDRPRGGRRPTRPCSTSSCATSCRRGTRSPAARPSAPWCTPCSSSSTTRPTRRPLPRPSRRRSARFAPDLDADGAAPPDCSRRWPPRWATWPAAPR